MKEKNIKVYLIPLIAVSIFTVLLFTAGYAYFTSSINMNTANYQITMPKTTSLVCTKTDCGVTITPAMMTNTNTNATVAKGTSNCSVSCTCSGTPGAVCNYNVTLWETGLQYIPSTGLSSNKEFTAKVTSPAGCTAQNTSGTETQTNTIRNNVVSACSLTVPSSGSTSATVSAEFKWYNLNLNQSMHASAIYSYELTTEDRTVLYLENVYGDLYVGQNISEYTDSKYSSLNDYLNSTINDNYVRVEVVNNIITKFYACKHFTKNSSTFEACVRGGDGGTSYESNVAVIKYLENNYSTPLSSAEYTSSYARFNVDSYGDDYVVAYSNGNVSTHDNSNVISIG